MGALTMKTLVRKFSMAGPCIVLGEFQGRTEKTITYSDPHYHNGALQRVGGRAVADGLIHTEPCQSCSDHPQSYYRRGYQD